MEIIAWGPVLIWVWAPTLVGVAWGEGWWMLLRPSFAKRRVLGGQDACT